MEWITNVLTKDQCRKILFNLGIKFGVSPKLISERLLSPEDKEDMLNGIVPINALEAYVAVWKENGMPDYAHGLTISYESEKSLKSHVNNQTQQKPELEYRKPFVGYRQLKDYECK